MFVAPPEPAAALDTPRELATVSTPADDATEADTAIADTSFTKPEVLATANLVDLWPNNGAQASEPQAEPLRAPKPPSDAEVALAEVPLLDEVAPAPLAPAGDGCANLLNFDELPEPPATFCDPEEDVEGDPLSAPQVPTVPSALEELDQDPELETEPHLLTNGETPQKEGTQVRQGVLSGRVGGRACAGCLAGTSARFHCDPHYSGGARSIPLSWASAAFVPQAGICVSLVTTDGIAGCLGNGLRVWLVQPRCWARPGDPVLAFLQASEGYFSQSQEEEFAQSEELCAKAPPPVFYAKPPGRCRQTGCSPKWCPPRRFGGGGGFRRGVGCSLTCFHAQSQGGPGAWCRLSPNPHSCRPRNRHHLLGRRPRPGRGGGLRERRLAASGSCSGRLLLLLLRGRPPPPASGQLARPCLR